MLEPELDVVIDITTGDTKVDVMDTMADVGEVGLSLVAGSVVADELYKVLVLTGSLDGDVATVLLACVLATAPAVPDGWMSRATYPKRPSDSLPHKSVG